MSKYEPLEQYLKSQTATELRMTFADVEALIGTPLPRSAILYASNHVHAQSWLDAGYRTEQVDMDGKTLVFVRESALHGVAESQREFEPMEKKQGRHPLIGSMKGTFTIEPGWDLTKPALDEEELEEMEANLERTADLIAEGLSGKSR